VNVRCRTENGLCNDNPPGICNCTPLFGIIPLVVYLFPSAQAWQVHQMKTQKPAKKSGYKQLHGCLCERALSGVTKPRGLHRVTLSELTFWSSSLKGRQTEKVSRGGSINRNAIKNLYIYF